MIDPVFLRRPGPVALLVLLAPLLAATSDEPTLEQRLERLCDRMEQRRQDLHIPGMGLAVVKDDEVILARGFGMRDLERELPVTAETFFCIGSTGKAFTTMLIAMLADDGVLDFEDPVSKHLPQFRLMNEEANTKVNLIDLLSHRTGITRMSLVWFDNGVSRAKVLSRVPFAKEWAPFRQRFLYNNVMYLAAGEAAARAAGSDWDTLVRKRIFDPLGMEHTCTRTAELLEAEERARGYDWDAAKEEFEPARLRNIDNVAPAGAIFSNVSEMAQWVRLLLGRGVHDGRRLVSEESFERLWQRENEAGPGVGYGLGWMLRTWNGKRVVEHGGNIDGYAAEVALAPDDDLGFVLLCSVTATPLQQTSIQIVGDVMLGDWDEMDPDADLMAEGEPIEEGLLQAYLGEFQHPTMPIHVTFALADGRLTMQVAGQPAVELRWPDARERWRLQVDPAIHVTFEKTETGRIKSATLFQAGRSFELPRRYPDADPDAPMTGDQLMDLRAETLGTEALADFGDFRLSGSVQLVHTGLDGRWTVVAAEDGRLLQVLDFGEFGRFEAAFDGLGAATSSVLNGFEELEADAAVETVALQHPAAWIGDWRDHFEELYVAKEGQSGELRSLVVELTTFAGDRRTRHVDPETGRLLQELGGTTPLGPADPGSGVWFEDYREVEGVSMPWRLWTQSEGAGRIVFQVEGVETEFDVSDETFALTPPPTADSGSPD